MASLFNQQISATYQGLLKTTSNGIITSSLAQITDGSGNGSQLYLSTTGINFYNAYSFPNADGSANQVLKTNGSGVIAWADDSLSNTLNFIGTSGTGSVLLSTQNFSVLGTANEIVTTASSQAITLSFPTAGVTLPNGSVATTQAASDNSTKIATTAYADAQAGTGNNIYRVVKNVSGATINIGQAVYYVDSTASPKTVSLAKSNSVSTMPAIGIADEQMLNNAQGNVLVLGVYTKSFGDINAEIFISDSVAGEYKVASQIGNALVKQKIADVVSPTKWKVVADPTTVTKTSETPNANSAAFFSNGNTLKGINAITFNPNGTINIDPTGETIINGTFKKKTSGVLNYTFPNVAPTANQVLTGGATTATTLVWVSPTIGTVTGTGTTGTLSKWASASSLTDSLIVEASSNVTINSALIVNSDKTILLNQPNTENPADLTNYIIGGGSAMTTGSSNIGFGFGVLNLNETGIANTAIGKDSLKNNVDGDSNTAVGNFSLNLNTSSHNTACGTGTLTLNTLGRYNTAIGADAGSAITTGSKNVIIGSFNGRRQASNIPTPPIIEYDIRTSSNNIILSDGDGNVRQVINSNGNVGIGTTSPLTINGNASAGSGLHVNASSGFGVSVLDGADGCQMFFNDRGAASNSRLWRLLCNDGSFSINSMNDDISVKSSALTIASDGLATFSTIGSFGSGSGSKLNVGSDSGGAFLEATNSKTFRILTGGNDTLSIASSGYMIQDTSASTSTYFQIRDRGTTRGFFGTADSIITTGSTTNSEFIVRSEADFAIATGGGTRRLAISSIGDVGIGHSGYNGYRLMTRGVDTTSSNFAFFAENSITQGLLSARNDGYIRFNNIGSTSPYQYAVSGRDAILNSSGEIGTSASIRKAKINIENETNVSWLYDLNPVKFNYRKKDEKLNYLNEAEEEQRHGLIAEEVEEVNTDFCWYNVNEEGDKDLAGVDYKMLITPMLKAIQEQQTIIEDLKARIEKLEL